MRYLELSGSKYPSTQLHIPEEPNSQIGILFVRRNVLHSEASVLVAVLQEPSSVSQPAGSKHSLFSQTNINKGLLPQWQRRPILPHIVI